jgi:hypothetical protein
MILPAMVMTLTGIGVFAGMLVLMEVGARLAYRRRARDPEDERSGTSTAEGAVFALLGLLIAFTFSGALDRFETRRAQIIDESNAIGTAWLRTGLLQEPERGEVRQAMREYVDARLSAYADMSDPDAARAALARANDLQGPLWAKLASASKAAGESVPLLLLPAVNDMFDLASTRVAALENHPPMLVYLLLVTLALACALLAGFAMGWCKRSHWAHRLIFAVVVALTVYAILDLEYPRQGFVRIDKFDRVLVDLRASMK